MALSDVVTLHPGMNNFNTNLQSTSASPPPALRAGATSPSRSSTRRPDPGSAWGTYATTGLISDNGYPLTQPVPDLTAPPHNVAISGFPPATLLMSGDVTITTGQTPPPNPTPTPTPHGISPKLTFPATARLTAGRATVLLRCGASANCAGTLSPRSQASAARHAKVVTCGSTSFSIPAGAARSLTVPFTNAGRAIGRRRMLHAYVVATFTGGGVQTASAPITLRL